jgi:hypothetical protein
MITQLELRVTDGFSVSLGSVNIWRLAGAILNITYNYDQTKTNEMHFFKVNHVFKILTRSYMFRRLRISVFRVPKVILPKLCVCYIITAYTQFRQDYFGLPEDGAPEAPKHVGVS